MLLHQVIGSLMLVRRTMLFVCVCHRQYLNIYFYYYAHTIVNWKRPTTPTTPASPVSSPVTPLSQPSSSSQLQLSNKVIDNAAFRYVI